MRQQLLKFKHALLFACLFSFGFLAKAQDIDTVRVFESALYGKHLVYFEATYWDLNEDGDFNGAVCLSGDSIVNFSDYSAAIAFYGGGLQARDGGNGFVKSNDIIPTSGEPMKLWFALNVPYQTYQVYAQSQDMEEPVAIYNGSLGFRNTDIGETGIAVWQTFHYDGTLSDSVSVEYMELQTNSDASLKYPPNSK